MVARALHGLRPASAAFRSFMAEKSDEMNLSHQLQTLTSGSNQPSNPTVQNFMSVCSVAWMASL